MQNHDLNHSDAFPSSYIKNISGDSLHMFLK